MRVILNVSILRAQRTGIGTYVAQLAAALQRNPSLDMRFFCGRGPRTELNIGTNSGSRRIAALLRDIPGAYPLRRHRLQRNFDRTVRQLQPALYHDPSLWPLRFDGPSVMTIHDLTHLHFRWTQPAARLREIDRHLETSLAQTQRILVDSHFIAEELIASYHIARDRIAVAPLGCSTIFYPRPDSELQTTMARFNLTCRSYFLFVGTLEPRKNLALALRAHARLTPQLRQRFPLVIVGGIGWQQRELSGELQQALADGRVRRLGYLTEADLAEVMAAAKLFVFPSLYEGFGIPLVEAMASGTPVISSNAACLPEVGGDAIRYVAPDDLDGLTQLMCELVEDDAEWARLRDAGIRRARLFSWDNCATITAQAYRSAQLAG